MQETKAHKEPIYCPGQDVYYVFRKLPESDQERISLFFQKARDEQTQKNVAFASTISAESEEHSRIKAYRHGLRAAQYIYRAIPLLRMHPVRRMLHLVREERDTMHLAKGDLTKDEIRDSLDKLELIEALITQSLRDYPEELNTPLIQNAFHEAHKLVDGVYLGQASLVTMGQRHWDDVAAIPKQDTEQNIIPIDKNKGPSQ